MIRYTWQAWAPVGLITNPEGEWVKFEEVQPLLVENKNLKQEVESLKQTISALEWYQLNTWP